MLSNKSNIWCNFRNSIELRDGYNIAYNYILKGKAINFHKHNLYTILMKEAIKKLKTNDNGEFLLKILITQC